jgi:hypothetical protein
MTYRDFAYWLQGYMEINDPKSIDEKGLEIIREHMNLVVKEQTLKQNQGLGSGGATSFVSPGNVWVTC